MFQRKCDLYLMHSRTEFYQVTLWSFNHFWIMLDHLVYPMLLLIEICDLYLWCFSTRIFCGFELCLFGYWHVVKIDNNPMNESSWFELYIVIIYVWVMFADHELVSFFGRKCIKQVPLTTRTVRYYIFCNKLWIL